MIKNKLTAIRVLATSTALPLTLLTFMNCARASDEQVDMIPAATSIPLDPSASSETQVSPEPQAPAQVDPSSAEPSAITPIQDQAPGDLDGTLVLNKRLKVEEVTANGSGCPNGVDVIVRGRRTLILDVPALQAIAAPGGSLKDTRSACTIALKINHSPKLKVSVASVETDLSYDLAENVSGEFKVSARQQGALGESKASVNVEGLVEGIEAVKLPLDPIIGKCGDTKSLIIGLSATLLAQEPHRVSTLGVASPVRVKLKFEPCEDGDETHISL